MLHFCRPCMHRRTPPTQSRTHAGCSSRGGIAPGDHRRDNSGAPNVIQKTTKKQSRAQCSGQNYCLGSRGVGLGVHAMHVTAAAAGRYKWINRYPLHRGTHCIGAPAALKHRCTRQGRTHADRRRVASAAAASGHRRGRHEGQRGCCCCRTQQQQQKQRRGGASSQLTRRECSHGDSRRRQSPAARGAVRAWCPRCSAGASLLQQCVHPPAAGLRSAAAQRQLLVHRANTRAPGLPPAVRGCVYIAAVQGLPPSAAPPKKECPQHAALPPRLLFV
jgi:hypothetical protein